MKRFASLLGMVLLILAGLFCSNRVVAEEQPTATELVRLLGSDDFNVREQASKRLMGIGLPARKAILQGVQDADLEIRRRCRELLPAIEEAERQARLAAFIADKDGKQKHDLPGWERYRKVAGEDTEARKFFVEIQKRDISVLVDADKDPKSLGNRLNGLSQNLLQRNRIALLGGGASSRDVSLAEIAPLLLVVCDPKVKIPPEQSYSMTNLLYHSTAQNVLRKGGEKPFRRIVMKWMEHRMEFDNFTVFHIINQYGMSEGLDLALRHVRDKKATGASVAPALVTIGKFGDKQHAALLEGYLDDKTEIGGFAFGRVKGGNVNGNTQVRDAALASLVRLTKQKPKDYGFAITEVEPALDYLLDQSNCLGFSSNERRAKAFEKWKAWKTSQKN